MRNKKVGLDLDGVLYPFQKVVYNILCKHHFLEMSYKNFWLYAKINGYMQKEITDLVHDHDTYLMAEVSTLNKQAITELVLRGNEIFYITSRPSAMETTTKTWLVSQGLPFVDNLRIGSHSKIDSVLEFGCDVFVDDRGHVIEELKNITKAIRYLSDYMYEQEVIGQEYIKSLWELVDMEV